MSDYQPADARYDKPDDWFRKCGRTGLKLPAISLGCWHNFGGAGTDTKGRDEPALHENATAMLRTAFDHGCTHFDLANNYGPPPGSAEERVGRTLASDFAGHRDELIISTKAGWGMWDGPYGDLGSRKYLLASLDQSLERLGLDYVDIYYHHRPDTDTPLDETLGALDTAVKSGKALYAAISSYSGALTADALVTCERNGLTKPILHQPNYNMFDRWIEGDLLPICERMGLGTIVFSPLAQGLLTNKYLSGIPDDSRAKQESGFLQEDGITAEKVAKVQKLAAIAGDRGQTLAQFALAWVLREQGVRTVGPWTREPTRVTSALIGASRPEQVADCCKCLDAGPISTEDAERVEKVLAS
ncbi:MAG: aldo/keto reductase [Planctomycetota bacterium]